MVEESPAAGRPIVGCAARKHSPWTCDRTRKKNKAHRGSPECHEALAEALEEEDEETDDHDMTEQEVHMLASLNQLGIMGCHGDTDGAALYRSGSAPDGRRKVRGTRAQVSSGFYSRLRLCALNGEGSPVAQSSKSCTVGHGGQENTPPVFFTGAEQSKCWLGPRHSPIASAATESQQPLQRASGVVAASQARFQADPADQSLTTAAALASVSRLTQDASPSPAPKTHTHRRQGSWHPEAPNGLADSAEALHGNAACMQGSKSGSGPHPSDQGHDNNHQAQARPSSLGSSDQLRNRDGAAQPSLTPTLDFSVSKYGIAAFGVPAAVHSCFAGPTSSSAQLQEDSIAASVSHHLPRRANISRFSGNALSATGIFGNIGVVHEPVLGHTLGKSGHLENPGVASGSAKALADSAEEMELRRLAHQLSHSCNSHGPESHLHRSQARATPLESRSGLRTSTFAATASATAWALPSTAPGAPTAPFSAPFDLAALAQSAGSILFSAAPTVGSGPIASAIDAMGISLVQAANNFRSSAPAADTGAKLHAHPSDVLQHGGRKGYGLLAVSSQKSIAAGSSSGVTDASCHNHHHHCNHHRHQLASSYQGSGGTNNERTEGIAGGRGGAQDDDDVGDEGDGDDVWLRTSQQTPDPDDPSSTGKFSAGLMRRVQDANAHEELYGGIYGLYHSQDASASGPRYGYGYTFRNTPSSSIKTGGSMEPSPLPRLSSRLRRLRASPYAAGSSGGRAGGGPPSVSPTPSSLGARCRSAGVTPGNGHGTGRRLRRRSDLVMDSVVHGVSSHGRGAEDSDSDLDGCPDQLLLDNGQQRQRSRHQEHAAAPHQTQQAVAAASGGADVHHLRFPSSLHSSMPWPYGGGGGAAVQSVVVAMHGSFTSLQPTFGGAFAVGNVGGARVGEHGPRRGVLTSSLSQPVLPFGSRGGGPVSGPPQQRSQSHTGNAFLSGLMDYDDEGVEYATPPHTPLRGVGGNHDHDVATARRAVADAFAAPDAAANGPAPAATKEALFGPARARLCYGGGRGEGPPRVGFVPRHMDGAAETPHVLPGGSRASWNDGRSSGGGGALQWLVGETQGTLGDFNKWLGLAANKNDRGSAERLWHEMCSRGVAPDIQTLNSLLRCLSRSAADPDEAQLLVCEVCSRGGFSPNSTSQRLLEEICFRFEQLAGLV